MIGHRRMLLMGQGASVVPYSPIVLATQPTKLIQYLPLWEASGTNADDQSGSGIDGTFGATADLGNQGIGDGRTSLYCDGTTDTGGAVFGDFASVINYAEGSLGVWMRMTQAALDAPALRWIINIYVNNDNQIFIETTTTANQVKVSYEAGNAPKTVNLSVSDTDWHFVMLTWSKSNDRVGVFIDGAQSGSYATTLGTWAGTPIYRTIGKREMGGTYNFHGWLAHVMMWSIELTPTEVAGLWHDYGSIPLPIT